MTVAPELLYNPFVPGFTDDPYPHYRRVREADPVHEHPMGFWLLTAYDDVTAALRSGMSVDYRNLAPGLIQQQMDKILGPDVGTPLNQAMVDRDPPDHTRLRSLVSKVFTPRSVAGLATLVTSLVDEALDRIADAGAADLVDELAFPLPFAVIATMLGMPDTDNQRIRAISGRLVRRLEFAADPASIEDIVAADREMSEVMRELVARKRANPGADLLSALIQAEDDGDKLTDDEVIAQVVLLYLAGHETVLNLVANGVVALLRNPAQLALLRAEPSLTENMVEEVLRYDSPVQQARRITTEPFHLRGRAVPAGALVIPCLGAANRDPARFGPDAEEFRVDRADARGHVSFGAGPHFCLGAALGRLQGRIVFSRLVARFPRLAPAGTVRWNGRVNVRGAESVPISVR
jgi:cytochrome P450